LMAHAGDELRLVLARHLELAALVLEFSSASTQFGQQPSILDGYDSLGSEVLNQLDLLVGERSHLLAVNADHANELVLLQHLNGHKGSGTAVFCDQRVGDF